MHYIITKNFPHIPSCIALTVASLTTLHAGSKEPLATTKEPASISLFVENDTFADEDEEYTSGLRLAWLSETSYNPNELAAPQRLLRPFSGDADSFSFAQKIWGLEDNGETRYRSSYSLSQLMYTPVDESAMPPADERPYAGWLGIGVGLHVNNGSVLNALELSIGITGPNSFAEDLQESVHNSSGFNDFEGWDSQIPEELTVNLHFNQKRKLTLTDSDFWNCDGVFDWGGSLGTFRVDAHAAITLRAGCNLSSGYSDSRFGFNTSSHQWDASSSAHTDTSCYVFLGGRVNAVAHDVALDGPVFRSYSSTVDREDFIGEVFAGAALCYRTWEISYAHTLRSKEYTTQKHEQYFGTITLRKHF